MTILSREIAKTTQSFLRDLLCVCVYFCLLFTDNILESGSSGRDEITRVTDDDLISSDSEDNSEFSLGTVDITATEVGQLICIKSPFNRTPCNAFQFYSILSLYVTFMFHLHPLKC